MRSRFSERSQAVIVPRREALLEMAEELFAQVRAGTVKVPVRQTYALKDAARAHQDLEGRRTTGSSVLLP